jgi:hypothetical protein
VSCLLVTAQDLQASPKFSPAHLHCTISCRRQEQLGQAPKRMTAVKDFLLALSGSPSLSGLNERTCVRCSIAALPSGISGIAHASAGVQVKQCSHACVIDEEEHIVLHQHCHWWDPLQYSLKGCHQKFYGHLTRLCFLSCQLHKTIKRLFHEGSSETSCSTFSSTSLCDFHDAERRRFVKKPEAACASLSLCSACQVSSAATEQRDSERSGRFHILDKRRLNLVHSANGLGMPDLGRLRFRREMVIGRLTRGPPPKLDGRLFLTKVSKPFEFRCLQPCCWCLLGYSRE